MKMVINQSYINFINIINLSNAKYIIIKSKKKEKITNQKNYCFKRLYIKLIIIIFSIYIDILFYIYKINNNIINYNNFEEIKENDVYLNPYFEVEKEKYNSFLLLKDCPKNMSDPLILKEKNLILEKISQNIGKNITSLDIVYYDNWARFGNQLVTFNKVIFYSEMLGVKKIILDKDNPMYIRNNINDSKYNLFIEVNYDINKTELQNYSLIYYLNNFPMFFVNFNIRVENRFSVIKNEILRNLPRIKTNPKDLYIHIRGGDIFNGLLTEYFAPFYAQPPFCFYEKIIEKNNFHQIYIIAEDKLNPIVDKLLNKYPKIIYNNTNTMEKDISTFIYAYNIVGSISSFLSSIIKINVKLKYFWEYDIYKMQDRILHMHHSIYYYPRNYLIFRMEPSDIYKRNMYTWINSEDQRNIMINDNCTNEFKIIKPNIK